MFKPKNRSVSNPVTEKKIIKKSDFDAVRGDLNKNKLIKINIIYSSVQYPLYSIISLETRAIINVVVVYPIHKIII